MADLCIVFRKKIRFLFILALVCHIFSPAGGVFAAAFVPEQPVMPAEELRPGMQGHMLTVIRGTTPVRLPIEVVSVISQKGHARHSILIRLLPSEGNKIDRVAQGMSGSPVYVNGRLIGAVSMGWSFSDHRVVMVTPIADMSGVFSWPDNMIRLGGANIADFADKASGLAVRGLSGRAVTELQSALGVPLEAAPFGANGELPLDETRFSPGDAIAVLLAWGDVEISAIGTVTATSRDGRFLAFGHSFLERGAVNFPVARATVHDTIFSQVFPFRIASPVAMVGTATQDRANAVGGHMGYFTPSIAATFVFRDLDTDSERIVRNFRVVPDAFLSARLLAGIYRGLLDTQWGRRGEGTAMVTMRVEGRDLTRGWTRTNAFFSHMDIGSAAMREAAAIIDSIMLQPFKDIYPVGFRLDVAVTREPKILFIEDIVVASDAAPGDTLSVEVVMRPWRRDPIRRSFELTIPENATGNLELIVRGGGSNSLSQPALDGGWKSIDSLERLLAEINAVDANNELILELIYDKADSRPRPGVQRAQAELEQEEREFLSETKSRRIREGTLKISRSEYVIEGLMRRIINLKESPDE